VTISLKFVNDEVISSWCILVLLFSVVYDFINKYRHALEFWFLFRLMGKIR